MEGIASPGVGRTRSEESQRVGREVKEVSFQSVQRIFQVPVVFFFPVFFPKILGDGGYLSCVRVPTS